MDPHQPTISLCMITCDEQDALPRCLNSCAGAFDEVIIVDTGSTDKTVDIALQHGARVYIRPWEDDFSKPRNVSLEHARKEWIFIMDADELLAARDVRRIRELSRNENVDAYQFITRNYTNNPYLLSAKPNRGEYIEGEGFRAYGESLKTRLFRNGLGIKFRGVIHELVDQDVIDRGLRGAKCDVPIHHVSEAAGGGKKGKKAYFYLRLSQRKVEENPTDGQAWWELGISQYIMGEMHQAIFSMTHAAFLRPPTSEHLMTMSTISAALGRKDEARFFMEKGICLSFPNLTHFDDGLKADPWKKEETKP